ncbi:hypothetical protein FXV77_16890 [Sphingobacterium phlebotomi]|uniref:ATP synthase protein I n=1 Tax=Sphingobacterium phlebotomi TaxID=2605433 RepID=A0A5D4H395_9SPHI|nr:hypothetical protein [Sphingobacterium phlebotomi]TYR33915.1 hypothetical protein FXV77_16890 [Sphingobacterium phlebotomi]
MEILKVTGQFAWKLLLGSMFVFGGAYLIQQSVDIRFLDSTFVPLGILLYIVTVFAYAISYLGIHSNPELGVYAILGGVMIKMLVSLAIFMVFLYGFEVENKVLLGLNFFCIYLLMSCFEVIILLRNLRRKIK